MLDVTLLYFDGCPSWHVALARLESLAEEFDFRLGREVVDTPEAAERRRFRGSPTILIDGEDVFATGDEPVGLSCRIHQTPQGPAGSPTTEQLRSALAAASTAGETRPTPPAAPPISLDEIDAAIAEATPALTAADRRLVTAIHRSLALGQPPRPEDLASEVGSTSQVVEQRLGAWPGVFRAGDGSVVGFWGLAIPEMPHRMVFDGGPTVHAWCAWDPLFLAPLVGRAEVETTDPISGAPIAYVVDGDGVPEDTGQVLSFLLPTDAWDEDVLGQFCHHVLHFTSRETGEQWVAEHPGTFLLPLADAAELGRRHAARLGTEADQAAGDT